MANSYATWDEWFSEFKKSAARTNTQLALDESNRSFIDFMDQAPLKRAFSDSVDPGLLGQQFAKQFDVSSFGKR